MGAIVFLSLLPYLARSYMHGLTCTVLGDFWQRIYRWVREFHLAGSSFPGNRLTTKGSATKESATTAKRDNQTNPGSGVNGMIQFQFAEQGIQRIECNVMDMDLCGFQANVLYHHTPSANRHSI
jgi:hypothetical protein